MIGYFKVLIFLTSLTMIAECLANYAYVVNNGSNTVSVIDTSPNATISVPGGSAIPVGLSLSE